MGYMGKLLHTHRHILVGVLLAVITLAAFWRVLDCGFINFDDGSYVTENRHVQAGFTRESVRWALTARYQATWQPLVWLSYMLDHQLYGLKPYGYHLTNLLLHIANTLLLFLIFRRMTGSLWRSGFVAALFAIHPLHVESVAWVAERKDVLSGLFWMLAMWAYVGYADRGGVGRYVLVMLALALGLMAKPVLVTLPLAFLLLDYWPLRRITLGTAKAGNAARPGWKLVLEKLPLFALATVSSIVTSVAQQEGGALSSLERLPFGIRIANALVSYVKYIRKMFWPRDLAIIYPHPMSSPPVWQVMGAVLALVCLSALIIWAARRRPYLAVGWLWYIGTLVPMIGLVQTGAHALADRFTYVPLIGIFIIIAWGVPDLLALGRVERRYSRLLPALAGAVTVLLMVCTWIQVGYWRSSVTVFQHAIRVTTNNFTANLNLASALQLGGHPSEAIGYYRQALRIEPDDPDVLNNIGLALADIGKAEEGLKYLYQVLEMKPKDPDANNNLGLTLCKLGRFDEGEAYFKKALQLDPRNPEIHYNLGLALGNLGKTDEAMEQYLEAVRLKPNYAKAHNNLGVLYAKQDNLDEAIRHLTEAVRIDPNFQAARSNLEELRASKQAKQ